MSKIKFAIFGQTPIDEDEKLALIPDIDTLEDLNVFEQENIIEAQKWIDGSRVIKSSEVFDLDFLTKLHKKMFGRVWEWAGSMRRTNKNIGCDFHQIRIELKKLNDDIKFWLEKGVYSTKQIALVFHHRLVKIHIFPNGNGRHARLAADCIVKKLNVAEKIDWEGKNSEGKRFKSTEELRKHYIQALQSADKADYRKLFELFDA